MAEDNTLADISKMGQFINPGTTDLESFLPFGNINFQTETSNITNNNVSSTETNPNRIAQKPEVLPVKVKSFGTTKGSPTIKQQHIRDHSVGFPPYDKKQIASTTQDKLLARVAKTQHRSYQHEDNSQYAKSFMYDASSTGAHKARYKAYGQKTYDKIGFNPEINNEEVFNANTSKYDDFVRMATQAAGPMFFNGLTANPKSYKNAFGGDFGQDVDEANSYEELSSIGMSTKGGLGGFFNNVFNSLAYTGGIMTEAAMEYAAIGAIEGAIVGPEGSVVGGAVGGAAGAIKGLLSVPKSLWNMGSSTPTYSVPRKTSSFFGIPAEIAGIYFQQGHTNQIEVSIFNSSWERSVAGTIYLEQPNAKRYTTAQSVYISEESDVFSVPEGVKKPMVLRGPLMEFEMRNGRYISKDGSKMRDVVIGLASHGPDVDFLGGIIDGKMDMNILDLHLLGETKVRMKSISKSEASFR